MRWRKALRRSGAALVLGAAALASGGSARAQLPETVTLEDALRLATESPRVAASRRDTEAARAERAAAGALANPSVSLGRTRPTSGDAGTVVNAASQQQATIELPVPLFGQRAARIGVAERQVDRASSQERLTQSDARRLAALAFTRLLAAQEELQARRDAAAEVERIRSLVAGRFESGVASRYDLARAEAELAVARLAAERAEADTNEQAAALAAIAGAGQWRPRAAGSLAGLWPARAPAAAADAQALLRDSPALRLARDERASAEARVELAQRERFPIPSFAVGRIWTSGPFGSASFIGVTSEIPILDNRRAQEDKARAEAAAARERERGTSAQLEAEVRRHAQTLSARRAALERFDRDVFAGRAAFQEMAESAYRLGRATLFELLDARRTQVEASAARIALLLAISESEIELRALAGTL